MIGVRVVFHFSDLGDVGGSIVGETRDGGVKKVQLDNGSTEYALDYVQGVEWDYEQ